MASSKGKVDSNFKKQMDKIAEQSGDESKARIKGNQVKWPRPEKWEGDVTDLEKMKDPFDRQEANQTLTQAIQNEGVVGDFVVMQTQIEGLATMERAFRARHTMSFPRAVAHAMARKGKGQNDKRGHAGNKGVFKHAVAYIEGCLKAAGSEE